MQNLKKTLGSFLKTLKKEKQITGFIRSNTQSIAYESRICFTKLAVIFNFLKHEEIHDFLGCNLVM